MEILGWFALVTKQEGLEIVAIGYTLEVVLHKYAGQFVYELTLTNIKNIN